MQIASESKIILVISTDHNFSRLSPSWHTLYGVCTYKCSNIKRILHVSLECQRQKCNNVQYLLFWILNHFVIPWFSLCYDMNKRNTLSYWSWTQYDWTSILGIKLNVSLSTRRLIVSSVLLVKTHSSPPYFWHCFIKTTTQKGLGATCDSIVGV